ncbi:uncharacterized protein LOC107363644 [Tetranychus urticae]|uniref:Uncharacterized protein n=1 Tax=Tetranychus urticae TaxID=32264 RepID=T1KF15_TETUR|nr:uncharacterized protein LOC107363644 [Tetranychus urticae]
MLNFGSKQYHHILLTMVVVVIVSTIVSARYLPTRNDDTRKEQIKELLRMFLEASNSSPDVDSIQGTAKRSPGSLFDYRGTNNPSYLIKRTAIEEVPSGDLAA